MRSEFDENLLAYFTDVEHLRDLFKKAVTEPTLSKRILVVHGVGGVGKSSLLRVFCLHCKGTHIPVALASGEEAKSALDILSRWTEDLKAEGISFSSFEKTFEHYHLLQTNVDEQAKKAQDVHGRMVDIAGKAASKTVEAAGGALAGAALGSIIPGIGTAIGGVLGGILAGTSAETVVDWLRGFLTKPDIDLLLDPTKKLTDDFLDDIAKAAGKRRIVLMLDTFEQMTTLEGWAQDVARKLNRNIFLVIAGRAVPAWSRTWQSWLASAYVEELKPMTEEIMRELVRRYCQTIRGGEPSPAQVEAIVRFARGLPIVVTSAVQLWVEFGVEDFQAVKPRIVADLVDRLMEGVPSMLRPPLEAAAVVRWFDQPILRSLTSQKDVREMYNELRRFPFVRPRIEGLALHDTVRAIMDENLQVQDRERHRDLHERAAMYFKVEMEKVAESGGDAGRLGLEYLYHEISANEKNGITYFQEVAENLVRNQMVSRLRELLNDVNAYSLYGENGSLWRDYYNARLLHISAHFSEAEKIYAEVSTNRLAEPKLRAYAFCDLGQLWTRSERLAEQGGLERAFSVIERSRQLVPKMDSKLVQNFLHLRYAYMFEGKLDRAVSALRQLYDFCKGINDTVGTIYSLEMLKDLYGLLGNWKMADGAEIEGLEILNSLPSNSFLQTRLIGHNIWHKVWSGQYSKAESGMREALAFAEQVEYIEAFPGLYRDIGLILGLQRRWKESEMYFSESETRYREHAEWVSGLYGTLGFWGSILARQRKFLKAEEYLAVCLSHKREIGDGNGIPEVLVWMGEMYEMKAKEVEGQRQDEYLIQAESCYNQSLDYRWASRRYFECAALTGLMRVRYLRNNYRDAVNLFPHAEEIAQEYGYHDLMASLHLCKGHIQWSHPAEDKPNDSAIVLSSYKRAMLHALCFNRFVLDEVVWGEQISTPLITVLSQCLLQGIEGRKMIKALSDWWAADANELALGIFENNLPSEMKGLSLTQIERQVRQLEQGDGTLQPTLIGVFNRFL